MTRILFIFTSLLFSFINSQAENTEIISGIERLMKAYPGQISSYDSTHVTMSNGQKIEIYKLKPIAEIRTNNDSILIDSLKVIANNSDTLQTDSIDLNAPSLEEMIRYKYKKGEIFVPVRPEEEVGRLRNMTFFKAMYGDTRQAVEANLSTIVWCPKLINKRIRVSKVNGVDKQLQKVSDELEEHPELKKYLLNPGTFNWRTVRGAKRLSSHSFGTAIDINIKYSNFWQWDCRCNNEDAKLTYRNQIPQKIVDIFEKHGFIWGGKWYHYDTMHFEYRPDLLME